MQLQQNFLLLQGFRIIFIKLNKMTLEFSFEALKGLNDKMVQNLTQYGVIVLGIKNSEDNIEQISSPISIKQRIFKKTFRYQCQPKGQIEITIKKISEEKVIEIAKTTVSLNLIMKLIESEKEKLLHHDIFMQEGEDCYLRTTISYDSLKNFVGKSLDFSECDFSRQFPKNTVTFYKGQCKTSNLFSFLDKGSRNKKFLFVENRLEQKPQ